MKDIVSLVPALQQVRVRWITLPIGDYVLCRDNTPICVIERKTWKDLDASIVDGRGKNHIALCEMSSKWGTPVVYVIEGTYRDEFKRCRTFLYHRMWKDNVQVLYTQDRKDTLASIVHWGTCAPEDWNPSGVMDELTQLMKTVRASNQVHEVVRMWMGVPQIGITTGETLFHHVSIREFLTVCTNPVTDTMTDDRWNQTRAWILENEARLWVQVKGISAKYAQTLQELKLLQNILDGITIPLRTKPMYNRLQALVNAKGSMDSNEGTREDTLC